MRVCATPEDDVRSSPQPGHPTRQARVTRGSTGPCIVYGAYNMDQHNSSNLATVSRTTVAQYLHAGQLVPLVGAFLMGTPLLIQVPVC